MLDYAPTPAPDAAVAIVGNAPMAGDPDGLAAFDHVVRINRAPTFRPGARADELVLINCGGQMAQWLATGEIERSPAFAGAPRITLAIHPAKADLIRPPLSRRERDGAAAQDHTAAATERFAARGKDVRVLTPADFASAMASLGHPVLRRNQPAPSTGFLVAHWFVHNHRGPVHAFGFGFAGWDGHDFGTERAWFVRSRVTVHPLHMAEAA